MEASGGAASPGRQHMLAVQACGPAGRLVCGGVVFIIMIQMTIELNFTT